MTELEQIKYTLTGIEHEIESGCKSVLYDNLTLNKAERLKKLFSDYIEISKKHERALINEHSVSIKEVNQGLNHTNI